MIDDDARPLDAGVLLPPGLGLLAPPPRPLPRRNPPRPLPDLIRDALPEIEGRLDRAAASADLDVGYGVAAARTD